MECTTRVIGKSDLSVTCYGPGDIAARSISITPALYAFRDFLSSILSLPSDTAPIVISKILRRRMWSMGNMLNMGS